MDDLISRQDAIDGKISIQRTNGVEIYSDEAVPVEYLKALPPAQPERKKGTYTVSGENAEWYCWYATCNECGKEWMGSRNFCPNCGADMRGLE